MITSTLITAILKMKGINYFFTVIKVCKMRNKGEAGKRTVTVIEMEMVVTDGAYGKIIK